MSQTEGRKESKMKRDINKFICFTAVALLAAGCYQYPAPPASTLGDTYTVSNPLTSPEDNTLFKDEYKKNGSNGTLA